MNIVISFVWFLILDHFLFNWTAKREAKKVNFDCSQCGNWACMYDRGDYRDLIMRDY